MDRNELIKLYTDGFPDDSIEFARYFVEKSNVNDIVTFRDENELISVAYIVAKLASLNGKHLLLNYLSAVSTLTERRGQGLVGKVIKNAISIIASRGVPIVALYPFDFDYYKRFGFLTASYCGINKIIGGNTYNFHIATEKDIEKLIEIYRKFSKRYDFCQIVDEQYFYDLFNELEIDDGKIYLSNDNEFFAVVECEKITRYAYKDRGKFLTFDELKGKAFQDFVLSNEQYIQMRIASVIDFLSLDIYDGDGQYGFTVCDSLINENNGNYLVTKKGGKITVEKVSEEFVSLTIESLFRDFFEGKKPFKKLNFMFMDKY